MTPVANVSPAAPVWSSRVAGALAYVAEARASSGMALESTAPGLWPPSSAKLD
jgi:hypothetical protein